TGDAEFAGGPPAPFAGRPFVRSAAVLYCPVRTVAGSLQGTGAVSLLCRIGYFVLPDARVPTAVDRLYFRPERVCEQLLVHTLYRHRDRFLSDPDPGPCPVAGPSGHCRLEHPGDADCVSSFLCISVRKGHLVPRFYISVSEYLFNSVSLRLRNLSSTHPGNGII